jgi:hypothetical protein
VDRSIAQGLPPERGGALVTTAAPRARTALVVGLGLVLACFALYQLTRPAVQTDYNHFAWQAEGWLDGQFSIRFPVVESIGSPGNAYFNDVIAVLDERGAPTGRGMIPFPPLPAVVLLPFVALFGLAVDQTFLAIVIGALDVGVAFWLLGRLPVRPAVRNLLTVFVGAGAALWYAASLGSTWYFAHVVAVGLTLAAVGLALDGEARAETRGWAQGTARGRWSGRAPWRWIDGRQVAAGFLLGLAATSRLTVALGFPFLVLVGAGGWRRRGSSAAIGMALPILGLLAYNLAATGTLFNPVYEGLYRYEVGAYPDLGYQASWSLQDIRYIPQNLAIMLAGLPTFLPPCDPGVARTPWSMAGCSWLIPEQRGMSFLLASPAYLLALPALGLLRDRRVVGAFVATALIATVNLMHFSQGWVQFGYRFSLDFAPFLLVAVALGTERFLGARDERRTGRLAVVIVLVAASVAIEAWGIAWARTLGW